MHGALEKPEERLERRPQCMHRSGQRLLPHINSNINMNINGNVNVNVNINILILIY